MRVVVTAPGPEYPAAWKTLPGSSLRKVSVCTPTWGRHNNLLLRCIPSVQAQDYEGTVEHVIVSDGPDPELASWFEGSILASTPRYYEMPVHHDEPNFGHYARMRAIELSTGEYVTYNDDDDALRPGHCRLLAAALDADPAAGFAVSRMLQHQFPPGREAVVGHLPWGPGNVGPPMIMHRRELLGVATWGPPGRLMDWEIVERWLNAGVRGVAVDAETADVWPSMFR